MSTNKIISPKVNPITLKVIESGKMHKKFIPLNINTRGSSGFISAKANLEEKKEQEALNRSFDSNIDDYHKQLLKEILHIKTPEFIFENNIEMLKSPFTYYNNDFKEYVESRGYSYKKIFLDFSENYTNLSIQLRVDYFNEMYDHRRLWELREMNKFHRSIYINNPSIRGTYASLELIKDNAYRFKIPHFASRYINEQDLILKDNSRTKQYKTTHQEFKTFLHRGQRKLCLNAIRFIVDNEINQIHGYGNNIKYEAKFDNYSFDITVNEYTPIILVSSEFVQIYMRVLSTLFSNIHFICFNIMGNASKKFIGFPNLTVIDKVFELEDCERMQEIFNNHENFYYINDVHYYPNMDEFKKCLNEDYYDEYFNRIDCNQFLELNEEGINYAQVNMMNQYKFYHILNPKKSLLYLRFPYIRDDESADIFEYLNGKIFLQCWAGFTSNESRIEVDGYDQNKVDVKNYDIDHYENQMFYFNSIKRSTYWLVDVNILELGLGYDHGYDSAAEIFIIEKYLDSINITKDNEDYYSEFKNVSKNITNMTSFKVKNSKIFSSTDLVYNKELLMDAGVDFINTNKSEFISSDYGDDLIKLFNIL